MSAPTIKRWLRRRRETGDVEPENRSSGLRPEKGAALEDHLPAQLRANPDLTLEEHRQLFEEARGGVKVSIATVSRAFKRLGLPLKKRP